ncbi:MAG: DUF4440 domain-containing protein [Gemmatimonadales bacterium]|nr:DUF4440 domain-containing protein [Gemmatimonadales bacterium]
MPRSTKLASLTCATALIALTLACADKKPDESAAMAADTAAPAAVAEPVTPPELARQSAAMLASFNAEDAAASAAFFTDSAIVTVDDSTYTGKAAIRDRWIKPGLPVVSDLTISEQKFTGSGSAMTENGKFNETVTLPKKAPAQNTGTYTAEWTNASGTWMINRFTVHSQMAPS